MSSWERAHERLLHANEELRALLLEMEAGVRPQAQDAVARAEMEARMRELADEIAQLIALLARSAPKSAE